MTEAPVFLLVEPHYKMSYKMRGECENDYHRALRLWKKNKISVETVRYEQSTLDIGAGIVVPIPDFVLTIQSNESKEKLVEILKKGKDLHVMYETLEAEHDYTGKRTYLEGCERDHTGKRIHLVAVHDDTGERTWEWRQHDDTGKRV